MIQIDRWPVIERNGKNCSVCDSCSVFFIRTDEWQEELDYNSKTFLITQKEITRYCRDCFSEYGGDELGISDD
jgi:hypothetical protein